MNGQTVGISCAQSTEKLANKMERLCHQQGGRKITVQRQNKSMPSSDSSVRMHSLPLILHTTFIFTT